MRDSKLIQKIFIYNCFYILCVYIICLLLFKLYLSRNEENRLIKNSKNYVNNYLVTNLYSNSEIFNNKYICRIKINSINIDSPVFSTLTEENLKLSPCLFSGSNFNFSDNICIAGHNYDNSMFFSDLRDIKLNDEVLVILPDNTIIQYRVFNIYEVDSHDFSPILSSSFDFELTLITCNNRNSKRLIVKCQR